MGIDAVRRGEDLSYYHRDEQLSTAFLTVGENGDIQNSYLYDAFGMGLEEQELFPNRIRYTGQQYDELTGQYYLRARYYNPVYGHFIQEDVYQGDGLNLYAYCDSNPVVYYDPSGYDAAFCGNAATGDTDEKTVNTRTEQTTQGNVEGGSGSVQTISNKFPNDNQAGKSFNYTAENGRIHIENGIKNVDFVIDMDGNLHIGRGHSYLAGGNSVQAAGTMKVNSQGYVRLITNESGHFQPTTVQAMNYPTVFRNAGLDIDNAWIRIGEFETSMSNYVIDSKIFYNGLIRNMP